LLETEDTIPLVVDQPEDEADKNYLLTFLIPALRRLKGRRQVVFATHDANIVVNGDADRVVFLQVTGGRDMLAERTRKEAVLGAIMMVVFMLVLLHCAGVAYRRGKPHSALFSCILFHVLLVAWGMIFHNLLFHWKVLRSRPKPEDGGAENDTVASRALVFAARTRLHEITCLVLAVVIYLTGGYFELVDKLFVPANCLYVISSGFFLLALVFAIHRTFAKQLAELLEPPGAGPADSRELVDTPADGQG